MLTSEQRFDDAIADQREGRQYYWSEDGTFERGECWTIGSKLKGEREWSTTDESEARSRPCQR